MIKFILITSIMAQSYDIVINGGRVMDPETGFDGIRNVGIRGDRIVEITSKSISGKVAVNAKGLVVSPGFIDLHAHGLTNEAHEYQARDGVTTALEMEGGVGFFREWIDSKEGKTIVNYGGTVPHGFLRAMAMDANQRISRRLQSQVQKNGLSLEGLSGFEKSFAAANYQPQSQK